MSPLAATTLARSSSLITRVRSAWPSTSPSHIGSRRGGASTSAPGRGASTRSRSSRPCSSRPCHSSPPASSASMAGRSRATASRDHAATSATVAGPSAAEIAPDQQHEAVRLGAERRAEPGLGGDHQRPPPERPRTAARRLDQRRRPADPPPQRLAGLRVVDALELREPVPQLVVRARRGRERLDLRPQRGQALGVGPEAAHQAGARGERGLDGGAQRQVVGCRHGVERRAHQAGLHEPALLRTPVSSPPRRTPRAASTGRGTGRRAPAPGARRPPPPHRRRRAGPGGGGAGARGSPGSGPRATGPGAWVPRATRPAPQGIGRTSQTNAIAIRPTTTATIVVARIDR